MCVSVYVCVLCVCMYVIFMCVCVVDFGGCKVRSVSRIRNNKAKEENESVRGKNRTKSSNTASSLHVLSLTVLSATNDPTQCVCMCVCVCVCVCVFVFVCVN
jgi:hypothetical protein